MTRPSQVWRDSGTRVANSGARVATSDARVANGGARKQDSSGRQTVQPDAARPSPPDSPGASLPHSQPLGTQPSASLTLGGYLSAQQSPDGRSPLLSALDIRVVKGGKTILDVADVSVLQGEVLAIIGPNGAGKSTLLSVLAALEFPATGSLVYQGQPVTKRTALAYRRSAAMVFQEPLLLDGSALDNVMLGLSLRGRREGAREKAMVWLDRFGVAHAANQPAHTLSGGEAQRVSLARAFVLEPDFLLMDEPFSSVDVISRQSLIDAFREVRGTSGTTTVLVTHDFREVSALANRVVVLDQGKVDAEGTPDEIAAHPKWGTLSATL